MELLNSYFETLSDIINDPLLQGEYEGAIDDYVSAKITEHNIQDEEGNYLENYWNIDSWSEAFFHFGYGWIDAMVLKGYFIEDDNGYTVVKLGVI